jgi:hypothetical protein
MKFIVQKNQSLDIKMISQFYAGSWATVIKETWPEIKSQKEIKPYFDKFYSDNSKTLDKRIFSYKNILPKLNKVSDEIEKIMDESWGDIKTITVNIGFCPIAPRFLSSNSFLLPKHYDNSVLLNWSTHEMIHFLYFKKWKKMFPKSNIKNYNYPDPVWVLSEILAPVIAEDPKIKKIIKSDSNLYDHWQGVKIDGVGLKEYFSRLYEDQNNFTDFLTIAWKKYKKLDRDHNLTKKLTK